MIELGVPFSDPMADGSVIMQYSDMPAEGKRNSSASIIAGPVSKILVLKGPGG